MLRILTRSRRYYNAVAASLAMCDGSQVFALIRDHICVKGGYDPGGIEHVVVMVADKAGVHMVTAECAARQASTQWCENPGHKKDILRMALKQLDELYP